MSILKVKLVEGGQAPTRATEGAAGYDCYIRTAQFDGLNYVCHLGFAVEIPAGHVGLLIERSSTNERYNFSLANCVGVIDQDYRGEVIAKFRSYADAVMGAEQGMRVAQLVVVPVLQWPVEIVPELSETARGIGGFGSTNAVTDDYSGNLMLGSGTNY